MVKKGWIGGSIHSQEEEGEEDVLRTI